jgi:hypothetical protein
MPVRPVCKNHRRELTRSKSPPAGLKNGAMPPSMCSEVLQRELMFSVCLRARIFAIKNHRLVAANIGIAKCRRAVTLRG